LANPDHRADKEFVMPRSRKSTRAKLVACIVPLALTTGAGIAVHAAGLGLKPGLWEVKVVKQVMDGRDMSAQMAAAMSQAQQALANLPPDQRARVEAMMSKAGVGNSASGGFRICVSPEMAQQSAPVLDKDGRCKPVMLSRHGDRVDFQFACTTNGTTMQGKGEATVTAESVSTHTEMTTTSASGGNHQMQNDTLMNYVSADCGDLKPPHGG
jgi:hypothetical protein